MIGVAVAVRLIYLAAYSQSPSFQSPLWDADDYHRMALALAGGKLDPNLVFRPPLYPLLLGVVYMVFGAGAWIPRLIQIGLGVWSCALVQRLVGRLYGNRWGMTAGLVAAFTGLMVYFDLELLSTSLEIFLELLFLDELLRDPADFRPWRAGLWLGVGALARPMIMTFFPVAFLWMAWKLTDAGNTGSQKPPQKSSPPHSSFVSVVTLVFKRNTLIPFVKFSAGFGLPLLISLMLHLTAGSGSVLVSAQGGVNFYIGNHPASDGMTANFPGLGTGWGWDTVRQWAESRAGKPLNAAETDKVFWSEGWKEIGRDPSGSISRTLRKAGLFWNRVEISNNRDLYFHARRYPVWGWMLWIGFPLLLPLALAGAVALRRDPRIWVLSAFLLVYFFTVIPFFVNARFRHPLTPVLIILAVGGVRAILALGRSPKVKAVLPTLAALAVGVWLPWSVNSGIDTHRGDFGWFSEGMALEKLGRKDEAAQYYQKALEANPRAPFVNFNLAELARERRNFSEALTRYRQELEIQPRYGKAWNNLGVVWQEMGEEKQALACFQQAILIQPGLREATQNAARIFARRAMDAAAKGFLKEAVESALEAVRIAPEDPMFAVLCAELRKQAGDTADLRAEIDDILRRFPGFQPAIALKSSLK